MEKLSDLRFVIGIFFITIGLLLMGWYVAGPGNSPTQSLINLRAGWGFLAFGGVMLLLSFRNTIPGE